MISLFWFCPILENMLYLFQFQFPEARIMEVAQLQTKNVIYGSSHQFVLWMEVVTPPPPHFHRPYYHTKLSIFLYPNGNWKRIKLTLNPQWLNYDFLCMYPSTAGSPTTLNYIASSAPRLINNQIICSPRSTFLRECLQPAPLHTLYPWTFLLMNAENHKFN